MVAATATGEARRTALQDAVIRALEVGGPGAVTHRAVAAEAGVPVTAVETALRDILGTPPGAI